MRKTTQTLVVLALGSGLALAPLSAQAQQARIHDRSGDSSSRAVDVTGLQVKHGRHRISATVTIPRLKPRRLSGTELLIKPRGKKNVYSVTVLRDRRGRVVEKSLSWHPLNDPIEPTRLACKKIGTSLRARQAVVSVATSCLTRSRPGQPVKAKVRTIDGTTDLEGAYYDDQTRFTPFVRPGQARSTAGPRGRVTARGGLVVRSLPTTSSARQAKLRHGKVYPLTCKVTGSVEYRGNDEDNAKSNVWFRLPGDRPEWVSALYMRPVDGAPPYCGSGRTYRGRVTAAMLIPREAPTTRANSHGGLSRGTTVKITCKLKGQKVRGNRLWYNLPQGLWVSARYVSNVGPAPAYCTR